MSYPSNQPRKQRRRSRRRLAALNRNRRRLPSRESQTQQPHALEQLESRLLMSAAQPTVLGGPDSVQGPSASPIWFAQVNPSSQNASDAGSALLNRQTRVKQIDWQGDVYDAVDGQWLVQLNTSGVNQVNQLSDIDAMLGLSGLNGRVIEGLGLEGMVLIEADQSADMDNLVGSILSNSFVEAISPNLVIHANYTPNDSQLNKLWGLHNTGQSRGTNDADIDAPQAWDLTTGDAGVVVAVIDTGVDYNHVDLNDNIWRNPGEIAGNSLDDDGNGFVDDVFGWDFVNNDNAPMDDNGHGTHVAGTIAGEGNNNNGVAGVTWNTSIMALKFLNAAGSGFLSHAVKAVNYATMMRSSYGVNVRATNNSWGGGGFYTSMFNAVKAANNAGILFVAAAGNDANNNDSSPQFPANYNVPNVLSVAATDRNDRLASFSNYGRNTVHLAAPGVSIYSTLPNNRYGSYSGTSMAAPHVTGVAALLWAHNPNLSVSDVRNAILNGVDQITALGSKVVTGGRLNAFGALQQVNGNPSPDRYEHNDSTQQVDAAVPSLANSPNLGMLLNQVTINGLNTVDDATDWFRFEMNDRGSASHYVRIDYNNAMGNLNLAVYEADGVTRVGQSTGSDSDDQVSLNGEDAGAYYIRVWAVNDAVVTNYTLNIKPSINLDDVYEDNDTRAIAAAENEGAVGSSNLGYVAGGRTLTDLNTLSDANDYYRFRTINKAGRRNSVGINFSHSLGDLDLSLYNEAGMLISSSFSVSNREVVRMRGLPAGVYYVRVYGYQNAANPNYSLTIKAPNGPKDRAGNDTAHARKHRGFRRAGQYNELVGMGDASDFYRVQFRRGGQLNLSLNNVTGSADLTLIDANGQTLGQLSTGIGAQSSSLTNLLPSGAYYAIVSSNSQNPVNYTLTVNGQEGPRDRGGNSLQRPGRIRRLRNGRTTLVREAVGFGDNRDYFRLGIGKRSSDLTVDLTGLTGVADLQLLDADGNLIDSSSRTGVNDEQITQRLAPGLYYVRVNSNSTDLVRYTLGVTSRMVVNPAGQNQLTALQIASLSNTSMSATPRQLGLAARMGAVQPLRLTNTLGRTMLRFNDARVDLSQDDADGSSSVLTA